MGSDLYTSLQVMTHNPFIRSRPHRYRREDFDHSPLLVFYEVTRACNLLCRHCRASAQPKPHPDELTSTQSRALIDQLGEFPKPPMLIITGGDPFKRKDVFDLVEYATSRGLSVGLSPSATPLATRERIVMLQERGLRRLAVSLDGATAVTHDTIRGVPGSFRRTIEMINTAVEIGLPVQVNTTLSLDNLHELDDMAELLAGLKIVMWSVFFLVPVGRAQADRRIPADRIEDVFASLWAHTQRQPYAIKTTEAPHYRRFVHRIVENTADDEPSPHKTLVRYGSMLGTNDGKGVLFVSHIGGIFPSGFLPIECGRFPRDSVVKVYQEHELFVALRDENRLGGKCGLCRYRWLCGGSRARAYALTGDPLAPEPDCLGHFPEHESCSM